MKRERPDLHHRFINLGYDEIRGIGRDSRTLRSGLTDGELLARSMDEVAGYVSKASPGTRTLFWDDMGKCSRLPLRSCLHPKLKEAALHS